MTMPELEPFPDDGLGYDVFGLHRASVVRAIHGGRALLDRYFRVDSHGSEHIPRTGPALLIANHSGVLPVDGAMLWLDVVRHTGRVPRTIADRFVPRLPLIGTAFARVGVVPGTRDNVRRLLRRGALVAIFPEGVSGVAKPFRERYHLQHWNVGHARLAMELGVPIIPVAIIGAEESWPLVARVPVHPFGAPYVPVPATPLPMPVRYHITYGEPIVLHDDTIEIAAARVRAAVVGLIAEGLKARDEAAHPPRSHPRPAAAREPD